MSFFPPLTPGQLVPVVALASLAIGYNAYWFFSGSKALESRMKAKNADRYTIPLVITQRISGLLLLGLLPALAMYLVADKSPAQLGIKAEFSLTSLWWLLGMAAVLAPMNVLNSRRKENLAMYPQIRVKEWTPVILLTSAFTWILYLLGYEFLFRGVLLFGTVEAFGIWPAILVNVALYSAVHIPKGIGEALGAIPFGALVCLVTLQTGTIWVAFLAHCVLALSNEWSSFYFHPDMRMRK